MSTNTENQRRSSTTPNLDAAAIHKIVKFLGSPIGEVPELDDKLLVRLLSGLADEDLAASAEDRAVLIRQIVTHIYGQSNSHEVVVPASDGWPNKDLWSKFGMTARQVKSGFAVRADPWIPDWLTSHATSVDLSSSLALVRNKTMTTAGDPFLPALKVSDYRSGAQRTAVRAALTAPAGSTLLVTLPTGEGKSLVYLSVAKLGYENFPGPDGVTLVVVPTVALAIDQKQAAAEHGLVDRPRAFLGGDPDGTNNQIIDSIKNGTQGLVFAAPESVSNRLRGPLEDAAKAGYLKAIIVDEAHLISAWGANFRPEFQVLSGLRRSLINVSPKGREPRTILLSATVTQDAFETMRSLFTDKSSAETKFGVVSGARLRPEIEYWAAESSSESIRIKRVEEALHHLPRPAILYTSRVKDAEEWFDRVTALGFRRVAKMTGHTSTSERNDIIDGWRSGRIDLVIGTSAFGLGINNQHVRTVIHACVPESLDRFYQEVGRGGRDGRASISVVIPSHVDHRVSKNLASSPLISVDVGFGRWQSMYHHAETKTLSGNRLYRMRVDVPPADGVGRMDMVGDQNTAWNQRTLAMLANTGLIELRDFESTRIEQPEPIELGSAGKSNIPAEYAHFQTIYVRDPRVDDIDTWRQQVETYRSKHSDSFKQNLQAMNNVLSGQQCVSEILAPMYKVSTGISSSGSSIRPTSACGGCTACRRDGTPLIFRQPPIPKHPWTENSKANSILDPIVDKSNRVIVFTSEDDPKSRSVRRRFDETLTRMAVGGVRSWTVYDDRLIDSKAVLSTLNWQVLFIASGSFESGSLPPGPSLWVGKADSVESLAILDAAPPNIPRLLILPERTVHPERPDRRLKGNHPIRWITFKSFIEKGNS